MAERLGRGLQIRLQRFNSASHLHSSAADADMDSAGMRLDEGRVNTKAVHIKVLGW